MHYSWVYEENELQQMRKFVVKATFSHIFPIRPGYAHLVLFAYAGDLFVWKDSTIYTKLIPLEPNFQSLLVLQ